MLGRCTRLEIKHEFVIPDPFGQDILVRMRPIFAIYLAAGLTLAFALAVASMHAYHAYATRYAIASLEPVGDDLVRLRGYAHHDYETVGWSLALVAVQATIIGCARKLKRQSHAA